MISNEARAVLRQYGIRKDKLEGLYKDLVKSAKEYWRDECIMDEQEIDLPKLQVQIGFNEEKGLKGRVRWKYSHMTAEESYWYYAAQIDLLEEDLIPIYAADYLYENAYYQRTGKVSEKSKQEFLRCYPDCLTSIIKDFEQVAEEVAMALM